MGTDLVKERASPNECVDMGSLIGTVTVATQVISCLTVYGKNASVQQPHPEDEGEQITYQTPDASADSNVHCNILPQH